MRFSQYPNRTYFLCALLIVLLSCSNCHKTPAYSHEISSSLDNSKWMSSLRDDTLLSQLSLPGTHESLSRGYGTEIAECHTLPLDVQLKAGIRVLDVRCRHDSDIFAIHHGLVFMHIMYGDVLNIVQDFLRENPTETVLMRVKEEYNSANVTRSFEDTFRIAYYDSDAYKSLFWRPNSNGTLPVPRLGAVRGKVVVLDNFSMSTRYGFNYEDGNVFDIQDDYKFTTNWDLYGKWEEIKQELVDAEEGREQEKTRFFMNYLSAAYGALPYFVASGHVTDGTGAARLTTGFTTITSPHKYPDFPRVDCVFHMCTIAFEGTNVLTMNYIQSQGLHHVGIIMADFPGDGLISSVIDLNYPHVATLNTSQNPVTHSPWILAFVVISIVIFLVALIYLIVVVVGSICRRRTGRQGPLIPHSIVVVDDLKSHNYVRF